MMASRATLSKTAAFTVTGKHPQSHPSVRMSPLTRPCMTLASTTLCAAPDQCLDSSLKKTAKSSAAYDPRTSTRNSATGSALLPLAADGAQCSAKAAVSRRACMIFFFSAKTLVLVWGVPSVRLVMNASNASLYSKDQHLVVRAMRRKVVWSASRSPEVLPPSMCENRFANACRDTSKDSKCSSNPEYSQSSA